MSNNELEELKIKCRAYEKEIEFLRINIKSLKIENNQIINSKAYKIVNKLRKLMWWKK